MFVNHVVMKRIHVVPTASSSVRHAPRRHSTVREGTRLGLIIGVTTWLWLAGIDLVRGEPFQTLHFFGFTRFTVIHFVLCLGYGFTIISAIHASMKEPTVMFGIIFSAILFEAGFVVLTAMIANIGIGDLAWGKFFVGNLIAAAITFALVARDHSLRDLFHAAEALQKD
jgi:hypothetical protein